MGLSANGTVEDEGTGAGLGEFRRSKWVRSRGDAAEESIEAATESRLEWDGSIGWTGIAKAGAGNSRAGSGRSM